MKLDRLLEQIPPAFKPFIPAVQKLLPMWMEKLKFKTSAIVINDAEDFQIAAQAVADLLEQNGAKELRRVDLEIEGKPITVLILGDAVL